MSSDDEIEIVNDVKHSPEVDDKPPSKMNQDLIHERSEEKKRECLTDKLLDVEPSQSPPKYKKKSLDAEDLLGGNE